MVREYTDEEIQEIKTKAFAEGAESAVLWLEEVYGEGIHETDAWAEYVGDCDCHSADEEEEE